MNKKVIKATRAFLIEENNVVAIKYLKGINKGFYDIPGGKHEEHEEISETSVREFKEETGLEILKQKYKGNLIIEYPKMIFDVDIFIVQDYTGSIKDNEENIAMKIDIDTLLKKEKLIPDIEVIKYLDKEEFIIHFIVDDNHQIISKKILK